MGFGYPGAVLAGRAVLPCRLVRTARTYRQHGPAGSARHFRGLWAFGLPVAAPCSRESHTRPRPGRYRRRPAPLLRSLGCRHCIGAARQVAGATRQTPNHGRYSGAAFAAAVDCQSAAQRRAHRSARGSSASRRFGTALAGRPRTRGRCHHRRTEPSRRCVGHRRKLAEFQGAGRRPDRRHHQHRWSADVAHHCRRHRDRPRADYSSGGERTGWQSAHSAPR